MLTIKQILEFGSGELPNQDGQIPVWDQTDKKFDFTFNINDYLKDITGESIFNLNDVEYNTGVENGQTLVWDTNKFIVSDSLWEKLGTPEGIISPKNNEDILTEGDMTSNQFFGDGSNITGVKYSLYNSSTGIISGGTISINSVDNSKFDIDPFIGYIIDQYTDIDNPTSTKVDFSGLTGVTITNIATQTATHIAIDVNGNIIQRENIITPEEKREYIYLGVITHPNHTTISFIENVPSTIPGSGEKLDDLISVISLLKIDGNKIYSSGSNLKIKKSSGKIFRSNTNYVNNKQNPNIKSFDEINPVEFRYRTYDGAISSITEDIITNEYETIDEFGVSTINTITGNELQATVQRVFMYENGEVEIQRGQNVYDTLQKAVNTFLSENFKTYKNIDNNAICIGAISTTVHCNDLSNTSRCVILKTGKYGGTILGGNYLSLEKNVIINELNDFPDPDENGFINLEDSWTYEINGTVNIAPYKIKMGVGTTLYGINPTRDVLATYTDGAIINGTNIGGILENIGLTNLHPTGEIFDIIDNGTNLFMCDRIYILDHSNIGKLESLAFIILDSVYFTDFKGTLRIVGGDGVPPGGTPSGTWKTDLFLEKIYILEQTETGNTFLTIDEGYFNTIKFWDGNVRLTDGNNFIHVDPSVVDVTLGTLSQGLLSNNIFLLDQDQSDVLTGITHERSGWEFRGNVNLQDSNILAYVAFVANTTATDITTSNTYFKVAGTNDPSSFQERMDITQANARIDHVSTTTPKISLEFLVCGSVSAAANNSNILIGVLKNGSSPAIIEQEVFAARSGESVTFTMSGFDTNVTTGDYYEIFVANLGETANITIVDMQFKVLKI